MLNTHKHTTIHPHHYHYCRLLFKAVVTARIGLRFDTVRLPFDAIRPPFHLFNDHFPGGPRLAGTRMCPFWILVELRMMEAVSGDDQRATRRAKLQSNRHHQQNDTRFLTGLSPNQQRQSTDHRCYYYYCYCFRLLSKAVVTTTIRL